MISSLIFHVLQLPNILYPICHEKLLKKGPSILYGGHYALAPLENHVGIYAPSILLKKCRQLVNILNLARRLYDKIGQWVEVLYVRLGMLPVKTL